MAAIRRDHDAPVLSAGLKRVVARRHSGWRLRLMSTAKAARVIALVALVTLVFPAFGQQSYVTRYDIFAGYSYLNSPKVSLPEHGVAFQIGMRPKTWYSVGFDYSNSN